MTPMIMMSGREVRRVPLDYKHPTRGEQYNRFDNHELSSSPEAPTSLFLRTYDERIREWWAEREAWMRGERPVYFAEREDDPYTFEEYNGGPPDPAYYLRHPLPPEGPDCPYGLQLWEMISEGSPISPVFEDSAAGRVALAEYMAEHDKTSILSHLTAVEWLRLISGDAFGTDIQTGALV